MTTNQDDVVWPDMDGWHKPQPEHVPRPTYAPALMAGGLMLLVWGAATAWPVSLGGLAVIAAASAKWIRDLRHGE
jgi:hypothetical protein